MNATIWLATSTLPVKFVSASGKNTQNNTSISWQADESNMQANNYQIQKSIDGTHFFAAATIVSKNQTVGIANYTWSVKENIETPVYYRIAVNENGVYSYSSTITINPANTKATIKIYPNPAPSQYAGAYTIEGVSIGNTVVIRNEMGKVCFQTKANSNTVQWNGNDKSAQKTPSGIYFVSIMNNDSGEEKIVGRISK
jgi:flagellar hook assembly protein FlgD